jgi:hypothetical protein
MADSCVILLGGNNPWGGFIATKRQDNDEKPSSSASLVPYEKVKWGIKPAIQYRAKSLKFEANSMVAFFDTCFAR